MDYVVDASVGIKWVFPEHNSEAAYELLSHQLFAPDLFWAECDNVLITALRRGHLSVAAVKQRRHTLRAVPVAVTPHARLASRAWQIALTLQHPIYDCYYLALAELLGVPMITDDRKFYRIIQEHKNWGKFIRLL